MTSESSGDVEQRRQELEAELARLADEEREQADRRRVEEQTQRDAQLDPELLARKTEIERRADEALEREFPAAWLPQKPEKGHPAKLVGLVLRIDPRVGPSAYGGYSAVIEVQATDGQEWTLWANESGAMYAQLVRLRIQPGEVIAVKYKGLKDSEQNPGQRYHDFKLARIDEDETPSAPIDYEALQRNRETPALPAPEQAPDVDSDIPF